MTDLESIPVKIETAGPNAALRTENLGPVLNQIDQALEELIEQGTETTIDLGAMPFSSQDEADLREFLGSGEVAAVLDAFGPTEIRETAVAGVWLVEHRDAEKRRLTLQVEICRIPVILVTPEDDLREGLAMLRAAASAACDP